MTHLEKRVYSNAPDRALTVRRTGQKIQIEWTELRKYMPTDYAKRAFEILREEGTMELLYKSMNFLRGKIHKISSNLYFYAYSKPLMRIKYGEIRPMPNEILVVSPTRIDYRIAGRYLPNDRPPYGTISGDWDLKKTHWKDESVYHIENRIFYGLIERFEEGKEWEDTVYYQTAMEFLKSGKSFGPLSNSQTKSGLNQYLTHLDELYKNIKQNGYDMSSIIKVHIGRDGEFIVKHGQHRLTIARITEVDEVPVRIQYRHKQWQELRHDIYENGLPENREELRNHPDLQDVLN